MLKYDVFLWCLQFDMCIVTLAAWFVVHKVIRICSQYICVQWDTKNLFSLAFTHIETIFPERTAISQQIIFVLNVNNYYSPTGTFVALFITSEGPFWMGDQTIAKPKPSFLAFLRAPQLNSTTKGIHMLLLSSVRCEDSVRDCHVCFWIRVFTYLYWSNSRQILANSLSVLWRRRPVEIYGF